MHVPHGAYRVAAGLRRRHHEEHARAVDERRRGAERDQRVHVRRAVHQARESADEKLLVNDHADRREDHLQEREPDGIVLKERRHGEAPHHVPHREIHEDEQEAERGDQPSPQLRRLAVLQGVLLRGELREVTLSSGVAVRFRLRGRALHRRAVAGVFHRPDDLLRRGRSLDAHRIREEGHRAGGHARHLADRLLHARLAGRAAHSRYCVLFQLCLLSLRGISLPQTASSASADGLFLCESLLQRDPSPHLTSSASAAVRPAPRPTLRFLP